MAGTGTGQPLTFCCAACRKTFGGIRNLPRNHLGVYRTGRSRVARRTPGLRMLDHAHEYRCRACGHTGWTRHPDILEQPLGGPYYKGAPAAYQDVLQLACRVTRASTSVSVTFEAEDGAFRTLKAERGWPWKDLTELRSACKEGHPGA